MQVGIYLQASGHSTKLARLSVSDETQLDVFGNFAICSKVVSSLDMLARSVPRCVTKLRQGVSRANLRCARPQCRRYSMPSSPAASAPQSTAAMLAPFTVELDKLAPSFKINGSQIQILQTPAEFYEVLKVRGSPKQRMADGLLSKE